MSKNGTDWSRLFSKTRIRPARSTIKSRSGSPGAVVRNVGWSTRAMGSARIVTPPPPASVCVKPDATPMAATADNTLGPTLLPLILITGSLSSKVADAPAAPHGVRLADNAPDCKNFRSEPPHRVQDRLRSRISTGGGVGVSWNPSTQEGFARANVDYVADFGLGLALCPADCPRHPTERWHFMGTGPLTQPQR